MSVSVLAKAMSQKLVRHTRASNSTTAGSYHETIVHDHGSYSTQTSLLLHGRRCITRNSLAHPPRAVRPDRLAAARSRRDATKWGNSADVTNVQAREPYAGMSICDFTTATFCREIWRRPCLTNTSFREFRDFP